MRAARWVAIVALLGAAVGAVDAAVRGMPLYGAATAGGWVAALLAVVGAVAAGCVLALRRLLAASAPSATTRARAEVAAVAIVGWAVGLVALADAFAARFSDRGVTGLLWAAIGAGSAVALAAAAEPLARALARLDGRAHERPSGRGATLAVAAVAIASVAWSVAHGPPPRSAPLGRTAAGWFWPGH